MDEYDGTCHFLQGRSFIPIISTLPYLYSGPFSCSQVREDGPGRGLQPRSGRSWYVRTGAIG